MCLKMRICDLSIISEVTIFTLHFKHLKNAWCHKFLHVTTISSFPLNQRAQYIWKCWMMFELLWYKRENLEFLPLRTFYIYLYWSILTYLSLPTTRKYSTHGHHQMVNAKIRLIILFAAKDGEALYSQQKQDWELTLAQIMNFLLPNSDWNWRK